MPIKINNSSNCKDLLLIMLLIGIIWPNICVGGEPPLSSLKPWEIQKRKMQDMAAIQKRRMQDRVSGIPGEILEQQSMEDIIAPTIDDAVKVALAAAKEAALPLIDADFHNKGKVVKVPDDFKTIQEAIDSATSGDVVLVRPGTYYELLVMKNGVKLTSDSGAGGDELISMNNTRLKLPRRTLRTIIDGSGAKPSEHGMFDFNPGLGRKTIIDGFTIQNLPPQNHHIPGHAHGLNVRGASPVITNCVIRNNGSTGIGNHVVYIDQDSPMPKRDFRWANIKHMASAVIYNNIIYGNLGLGIGCNHFSTPFILGNEIFNNSDAELGDEPSPGLGNKHGSAATIIGNIVHDNPGGGILCRAGAPQGLHHVDRSTHPTIMKNVVYNNGSSRAGISCRSAGSPEMPVQFLGNYVYETGLVGIAMTDGSTGIIEDNTVSGGRLPGIAINDSTALKLNRNKVTGIQESPAIIMVNGAVIQEMIGNAAETDNGPRFLLRDGTIGGKGPVPVR